MTVADTGVVNFIGIDSATGRCVLTIPLDLLISLAILAAFGVVNQAVGQPSALLEADWMPGSGDGLLTLDTNTGLEWLDLTVTENMSVTTVSAQFGSGGSYEGFQYASAGEVGQLFTDAGLTAFTTTFATVGSNSEPVQLAAAESLQALWGITKNTDTSLGFINEQTSGPGTGYILAVLQVTPTSWVGATRGTSGKGRGMADEEWGSVLVREAGTSDMTGSGRRGE